MFNDLENNNSDIIASYAMQKQIPVLERISIYYALLTLHFYKFNSYLPLSKALACIIRAFDFIRNKKPNNVDGNICVLFHNESILLSFNETNLEFLQIWIRHLLDHNSKGMIGNVREVYNFICEYEERYSYLNYINKNLRRLRSVKLM